MYMIIFKSELAIRTQYIRWSEKYYGQSFFIYVLDRCSKTFERSAGFWTCYYCYS